MEHSSASMFDLWVERSPDLVARFDRRLRVLYVNGAVERATGVPRARFLGSPPEELALPPELGRAWREWVEAAFASGREERFQLQYRGPTGLVAYEAHVLPEPGAEGAAEAVLAVLRDVTDRLRAERVAERAARLQAVTAALSEATSVAQATPKVLEQVVTALGASASIFYLLDKSGQTLEVAGAVGYTEEQRSALLRIPLSAPLPLCEAVRTGQAVWLPSAEETAARYPHVAHLIRGEMGGAVAIPLVVDGRPLGGVGLSFSRERARALEPEDRDFCLAVAQQSAQALDRVRAYEALRANEARFRRFVESNLVGVAFGDEGDVLTFANDAFLELLGYSREDLKAGRLRWSGLTPPGQPAREVHARCTPFEKEYLRRDGSRVPVLVGSAALDDAGTQWVCFVVDLSERVRKDAELRKSRDRLDIILRALVEGVTAQAADGRLVFANEAAARNLGYATVEVLLAEPPERIAERYEFLDEDGQPIPRRQFPGWLALQGQRPPERTLRQRDRQTGEERWFVANAVPLPDEDGGRVALSIFHDVTALKQAERRITEEGRINETLRRIGESFASELDHPRLVQRITDEATALTGARAGAFVHAGDDAEPPALAGAAEEAAWFARPEAEALRTPVFRGEGALRLHDAAAEPRHAAVAAAGLRSFLAVPVRSRSGAVLGGLFFGHPEPARFTLVHERMLSGVAAQAAIALDNARLYREAQQAERRAAFLAEATALLSESLDYEAVLRQLTRLAVPRIADGCGVVMVGPEGAAQIAMAYADPATAALGEELRRRYPPEPDRDAGLAKALRTGQATLYPAITDTMLVAVAKDAEHLRLLRALGLRSVMVVPISVRGTPVGVLTFATGGERRLTGSDLALAQSLADRAAVTIDNARHYRAAQEAVRVRDEFMSIASHELRTPLTPLALQLKSLMRNLQALPEPAEVTDKLGSKVEAAVRQTNRLTSLVNCLLDVTRISAGRLELLREEMDLAAMVRDVIERFADELEDAGCSFAVHAEAPVRGQWDRMRVEQVVTNLLSNALKYGAGRPITVDVRGTPDGAVLQVRDQGIGIAPADQARIFERFERAVSPEAYGGLGLGLYITRRIVEAHGGRIALESAPGQGSTFTVHLPAAPPARP